MKNLLFSAVAIITITSIASAQLYIAPNASTDSYVFVKGVQVYVDGTIELEKNSAGTTEASIYLREEAQLLQGGVDNMNEGDGLISLYQEGIADAYDYNMWTSPVSEATFVGNKNIGENQIHHARTDLSVTSSNAANFITNVNGSSSVTTLNISDRWFYRWNIATQEYIGIGEGAEVLPGQGFIMKGTNVTTLSPGDAETNKQRYDFRGRPNSGEITIPLPSSTFADDVFTGGSILVGNPYPSALDLNLFFYDQANNGSTAKFTDIKFYDEDRTINSHLYLDNKAGFGTWTPGASQPDLSVGTYSEGLYVAAQFQNFDSSGMPIDDVTGANSTGKMVKRRMSPIGQGFFIQSINTTAATDIKFKNSHRRFIKEVDAGFDSEFRNQEANGNNSLTEKFASVSGGGNTIEPPILPQSPLVAQLRINTYMGVSHMRQSLLVFHETATDEFDLGWDAISPMDATSEMYFAVQTPWDQNNLYPFVINAVPFDNVMKKIPVTFEIEEEMTVTVTGIEELDLPTDHVYMYDIENDTYQKITGNNAASYFLQQGVYEGRFYIVFVDNLQQEIATRQQTIDLAEKSVDFFQNNRVAQLEIKNLDKLDIKNASIFDMTGRLVLNEQNLGDNRNLNFPTGTFSDGVYLVILTTTDNIVIDYKILVENK